MTTALTKFISVPLPASNAPLLENYNGQMDNYSGPIYSNQYHSGPLQAQPQAAFSGPVAPAGYTQPMMDQGSMSRGFYPSSQAGDRANLAVLHGMIMNDLNAVRQKVQDYMMSAHGSMSGVDDQMERARVQDALAQIEQQQMHLGNVMQQNGVDVNIPVDPAMMASRGGSIAGDIPDASSMVSYG